MAKYRNVLNNQNLQPPIIPLFPVIKKDLTFLHEGTSHEHDYIQTYTADSTYNVVELSSVTEKIDF